MPRRREMSSKSNDPDRMALTTDEHQAQAGTSAGIQATPAFHDLPVGVRQRLIAQGDSQLPLQAVDESTPRRGGEVKKWKGDRNQKSQARLQVAADKWRAISEEERFRWPGGLKGFAKAHKVAFVRLRDKLVAEGSEALIRKKGGVVLATPAQVKSAADKWLAMSKEERRRWPGRLRGFAKDQGVARQALQTELKTRDDEADESQARLRAASDDWLSKSTEEQSALAVEGMSGLRRFAKARAVSAKALQQVVKQKGGDRTQKSLARLQVAADGWRAMPAEERRRWPSGLQGFAKVHKVSFVRLRDKLVEEGDAALIARTSTYMKAAADKWRALSDEERSQWPRGLSGFAKVHGVSIVGLRKQLVEEGGHALIPKHGGGKHRSERLPPEPLPSSRYREIPSSTEQDATDEGAWHGRSSSPVLHGPLPAIAEARIPAPPSPGLFTLPDATSRLSQELPRSIADDTCIKQEPPSPPRHTYDNAAPILGGQDGEERLWETLRSRNSGQQEHPDVLARKEVMEEWGEIPAAIERSLPTAMPPKEREAAVKAKMDEITRSAQDFLLITAEDRSARLDNTLRVVSVPDRGRGVEAARPIQAFDVFGPYAGKLLAGKTLAQEEVEKGASNVRDYMCLTQTDGRVVSGFQNGNALSMINEADAPEGNNVGFVRLGADVSFTVALRDIAEGEPMLVDYGDCYVGGWPARPIVIDDDAVSLDDSASVSSEEAIDSPLLSDVGHAGNRLFHDAYRHVRGLRRFDWTPDERGRLAAFIAVSAKERELNHVASVKLEEGDRVLKAICKRDPKVSHNLFNATIEVDVETALKTSLEESSALWRRGERDGSEHHEPRNRRFEHCI